SRSAVKAAVLERLGGPEGLTVMERPAPDERGGVLVDVYAAGVSFPDLVMAQGRQQIQPHPPFERGVDVAGEGTEAATPARLRPGQRVVFNAMGSWAEQVAVAPEQVLSLPDALTMEQGAGLLMNYHTAHFGLVRRGRLQPAETLLVHGAAGGVGGAAVPAGKGGRGPGDARLSRNRTRQ